MPLNRTPPLAAKWVYCFKSLKHVQYPVARVLQPLNLFGITLIECMLIEDTGFHLPAKEIIRDISIEFEFFVDAHEDLNGFVKGRRRLCRPLCRLSEERLCV